MFLVFTLKGVEPINNTSQKSWNWRNEIKPSIAKKKESQSKVQEYEEEET
jgi:hypothetical protein